MYKLFFFILILTFPKDTSLKQKKKMLKKCVSLWFLSNRV